MSRGPQTNKSVEMQNKINEEKKQADKERRRESSYLSGPDDMTTAVTGQSKDVCVCVFMHPVTHWSSQVNEFLSHLDNEVVFGHEGTVQAFIKFYQLAVHLGYLQHTVTKHTQDLRYNLCLNTR